MQTSKSNALKKLILVLIFFTVSAPTFARSFTDEYTSNVTFSAGYGVGDFIEFVKVSPISAGSSGYYEVSISYTRGNVAAAATHLAAITHANSNIWRETGRINNNPYGTDGMNFTIDCNGQYGAPRFRIRAINTLGVTSSPLTVYIKVRSININDTYTALSATGNDLSVNLLAPMTNEWSLFVGNPVSNTGAAVAIRAIENGNVGIGTLTPAEKLSVNGKVRAHEVKVETANWPDYVFLENYHLRSLKETEEQIKKTGHLPGIPSGTEVTKNGVDLGEMNRKLLEKIEEITLHLIEENKQRLLLEKKVANLISELEALKKSSTIILK